MNAMTTMEVVTRCVRTMTAPLLAAVAQALNYPRTGEHVQVRYTIQASLQKKAWFGCIHIITNNLC